ncbi:hypothetical protein CBM2589_B60036 [Cupriavidus taiwanensis]|uniref:Uncharacterized protein n=1 Tax=Cupriavidus taiwanensis TaxID=164546 RepID=A0A975X3V9_9BURK|nr:hypothetical protein CBM2589_B60036 [Cupriavidus taiwanensis]
MMAVASAVTSTGPAQPSQPWEAARMTSASHSWGTHLAPWKEKENGSVAGTARLARIHLPAAMCQNVSASTSRRAPANERIENTLIPYSAGQNQRFLAHCWSRLSVLPAPTHVVLVFMASRDGFDDGPVSQSGAHFPNAARGRVALLQGMRHCRRCRVFPRPSGLARGPRPARRR